MKKGQNPLSEKTTILKAILDNYEEAIWSVNCEFKFTVVNSYFVKEFKDAFDIDLKPGMHAFANVDPKLRKIWKPKYEKALKGNRISFEFEEAAFREKKYFRVNLLTTRPILGKYV